MAARASEDYEWALAPQRQGQPMLPRIGHIHPAGWGENLHDSGRLIFIRGRGAPTHGDNRILIINLNKNSMVLQTGAGLNLGEILQVKFPNSGGAQATITRQNGNQYLAIFHEPIGATMISAARLAMPAEPVPFTGFGIGQSAHYPSPRKPLPEWVIWAVTSTTVLMTALFIYSLLSLSIGA